IYPRSVTGEQRPVVLPEDATVIIPTVDPYSDDFGATMASVLRSGVRAVIISAVGPEQTAAAAEHWVQHGRNGGGESTTDVLVVESSRPNKRWQLAAAMPLVQTELVILADDHVFWPKDFVEHILAPFEDPKVGGVCCQKRVRRERPEMNFLRAAGATTMTSNWSIDGVLLLLAGMWSALSADLLNFLACLYMERYNFELRGSTGTDGSVYVISGRTAAYRTSIVQDRAFLDHFCNEYWLYGFGKAGPLNSEDDNCITRHLFDNGWRIRFQSGPQATMETRLGVEGGWTKFMQQNVRWARSAPRSNSTMLRSAAVYKTQPLSVYAVWIARIFNFTLYHDAALVWLAHASGVVSPWHMLALILATKMLKPLPHFLRHPEDLVYVPAMILFAWFHSFIKTWAVITILETGWGSRPGVVA
ncbi:hypothetical protein MAPG_01388, partial [Magnaporthiopsis poae ATCC 64411]